MVIPVLFFAQLALFAAGWLGPWRDASGRQTNGRLPLQARLLLSLSLLAAALLVWGISSNAWIAYRQWVLLGMAVSFIGDLIMARVIPVPDRLVGGIAAFAVAHALYITAFVQTILASGASLPNAGLVLGLILYELWAVGGWWILIRDPAKGTVVNAGALMYGLWIGVMASFALALAVALGGGFWLTALGGLVFMVSDFIIGITDIRGISLKNANDWVWLTYVAGQMGIIYAGAVA